ncbi:hypothetical protein NDU88_010714 [Pleurodeles waltl]|uniref:Uncharacterized protein n=1 Tax=Pleurodeles waltl TaxID=8319 RepID=A0AAV7QZ06_PLEWA|nr:hypothetical protein NDU88_010714 [Pleurodeles waltl]
MGEPTVPLEEREGSPAWPVGSTPSQMSPGPATRAGGKGGERVANYTKAKRLCPTVQVAESAAEDSAPAKTFEGLEDLCNRFAALMSEKLEPIYKRLKAIQSEIRNLKDAESLRPATLVPRTLPPLLWLIPL